METLSGISWFVLFSFIVTSIDFTVTCIMIANWNSLADKRLNEPLRERTNNLGFRPGLTKTGL